MATRRRSRLALDPAENRYFGEAMNVLTLSKLSRALLHASYTFRKKLSHTADSQDQRHRMTPGLAPDPGRAADPASPTTSCPS